MTVSEYIIENCRWEFRDMLARTLAGKSWEDVNEHFVEGACYGSTYEGALHFFLLLTK